MLTFYPYAFGVRFFLPGGDAEPQVKFFFSKSAIEKLIWFNGWMKKNGEWANIYLKKVNDSKTEGELTMEMNNFRINEHLGFLGAKKFLEKGIKKVDLAVFSSFSLQIMDTSLFDFFLEKECKVTFHCFEQGILNIDKVELLEIKAQVQMPLSC